MNRAAGTVGVWQAKLAADAIGRDTVASSANIGIGRCTPGSAEMRRPTYAFLQALDLIPEDTSVTREEHRHQTAPNQEQQ